MTKHVCTFEGKHVKAVISNLDCPEAVHMTQIILEIIDKNPTDAIHFLGKLIFQKMGIVKS